jgi:hypothetical protein
MVWGGGVGLEKQPVKKTRRDDHMKSAMWATRCKAISALARKPFEIQQLTSVPTSQL